MTTVSSSIDTKVISSTDADITVITSSTNTIYINTSLLMRIYECKCESGEMQIYKDYVTKESKKQIIISSLIKRSKKKQKNNNHCGVIFDCDELMSNISRSDEFLNALPLNNCSSSEFRKKAKKVLWKELTQKDTVVKAKPKIKNKK